MSSIRISARQRICFVAPYMGGNGKALYWGKLFEGLVARGMAVEVLTGPRFDRDECPNIVQHDTVSFMRFMGMVVPSPYVLVSLFKLKCDAMLILEFNVLALLATIISRLKPGTRAILLIENAPQFTSAKRGGFFFKLIRKIQCRLCSGILTNNTVAFDYLVKELGVPPAKITTAVYLTSSLAAGPLPEPSDVGTRKIRLVCIGRLVSGKGFLELIDEVALLSEAERARLSIDVFGAGPLQATLQKKIGDHGLDAVFKLNGNIPYAELGSRLSEADAFLMPSLGDYRSLASFEALSLGLPLLISVHDGAHGEVLNGRNGVLIDPLVRGNMSSAIRGILADPARLQAMRENSLDHARHFTVEKAVANITQVVARVTSGQGQGH